MAPHFSRARKGEPGGPEMRFAGAPTWDWSGRQKVSFNRSAALPRNGGRNGHPVTTNCDSASDNQRLELPAEASSERSRGDRSTPPPPFPNQADPFNPGLSKCNQNRRCSLKQPSRLAASRFAIFIKTSSVGRTQFIGIALQCSVGQLTRSGPFSPPVTWTSRPVIILPQMRQ